MNGATDCLIPKKEYKMQNTTIKDTKFSDKIYYEVYG